MDAYEIVRNMNVGWNLGNSLDTPGPNSLFAEITEYEEYWGNPVTTQQMISEIVRGGFNTIRIPVTWGNKLGRKPDYLIRKEWLDRVEEVVNYAYLEGVFVILDTHHEDEWLDLVKMDVSESLKIFECLWTQIAERFKEYEHNLVFETMNETRLIGSKDEWTEGTSSARKIINMLNNCAIRAIRKTGGKNSNRMIIVPTYGAKAAKEAILDIEIPSDDKNIILTVHAYAPYNFAMEPKKEFSKWGNSEDVKEVVELLDEVSEAAKKVGLPLLIGEFGTVDKDNEEDRIAYTRFYIKEAKKRGISCIVWDTNIKGAFEDYSYCLFDRNTLSWRFPRIVKAMIEAAKE